MKPADPTATNSPIEETAARWLFRRTAALTPAEKAEFETWHAADARHREAFARLERDWAVLDRPLSRGRPEALLQQLHVRAVRRRRRRAALAGATCLLLVGLAAVWRTAPPATGNAATTATRVAVVAPDSRTLPDGSRVELKPGAEITLDFSGPTRGVVLIRGAAHFQVAHDTRPFVVTASAVAFRAVGTAFTVDLDDSEVDLLVTEGRVAVEHRSDTATPVIATAAPLATVDAGNRLTLARAPEPGTPPPAPVAVAAGAVAEELSWRIPRLDFSRTPLAEAVALMNQHSRVRMQLDDRALGTLPVSGLFRADRVDAFVRLLEANFEIEVQTAGETIHLRRRR
jgi:transmembrane sensor